MAVAKVEPGKTRLGWIGTGVMGASMCGHLIDKGFAMTVFNRTRRGPRPWWPRAPNGPIRPRPWPSPPTWSSLSSAIRTTCAA